MAKIFFVNQKTCVYLQPQTTNNAEIAQLVEHDLAKVGVASSSLVFRSKPLKKRFFFSRRILTPESKLTFFYNARMVELVDTQDLKSCVHCGRAGSSPAPGTSLKRALCPSGSFFCLNHIVMCDR
jgi:hypothetical protein